MGCEVKELIIFMSQTKKSYSTYKSVVRKGKHNISGSLRIREFAVCLCVLTVSLYASFEALAQLQLCFNTHHLAVPLL